MYAGKYVDRWPELRAAGKVSQPSESPLDVLASYPMEEAAESGVKMRCRAKMLKVKHIPRTAVVSDSEGVRSRLTTELGKTRFMLIREKYLEDMYCKQPPLGKSVGHGAIPDHITNENRTFGRPLDHAEQLYELVLPNKSPDLVNREYIEAHDKYKISHNHYFPSERINRNYDSKYFNPNNTFGKVVASDKSGIKVKRLLTECEKLEVFNKTQKGVMDRTVAQLGKTTRRVKLNIPEGTIFGIKKAETQYPCQTQDLIENVNPCQPHNELTQAMGHINKIRRVLWDRPDVHVGELKEALEQEDSQMTGYVGFSKFLYIMSTFHIKLNKENMRTLIQRFKLARQEEEQGEQSISIDGVLKLLSLQIPLPPIMSSLTPLPPVIDNKDTSYRLLCADRNKKPNESAEVKKHCEETLQNAKTTAQDCIAPDTPMRFGILPSEFTQPRSKDLLRRFFRGLLSDDFDTMWSLAQAKLKTPDELISINQILAQMEECRASAEDGSCNN